ncbi:MAG: GntR family transcriptional regulator [Actinomycetes bacterium]
MRTNQTERGALPRRRGLADDVYEALKAMVMDHDIVPGARISIDGVAADLDVSPTPVREALARLEADGLAVKEPLRGYRATALLTRRELDDLFAFRLLIEPWAAARAAERTGPDDHARLAAEVASFDDAPPAGYDRYKALTAHDARFHALVTGMSGNDNVRLAFERTHCHLHVFRLYYVKQVGIHALAEHERIVSAVTAGDTAGAERAMRLHLEDSRDRLRPITADPGAREAGAPPALGSPAGSWSPPGAGADL